MKNSKQKAGKSENPVVQGRKGGIRIFNLVLLIIALVLVAVVVILIPRIMKDTFGKAFTCATMFNHVGLGQLCEGIRIDFDWGPVSIHEVVFPALKVIDPPLEKFREFLTSIVIIILAIISLGVTYIYSKLAGFIELLKTPEGRRTVLGRLCVLLISFAVLCGLFYFVVVK